jgi:hypothetical protein
MNSFSRAIAIVVGTAFSLTSSLATVGCSRGNKAAPAEGSASSAASAAAASSKPADKGSPIPRENVELVLNPGHVPEYDGPTGSVEGTVYVTGPAAPPVHVEAGKCPAAVDTYGKQFREGPKQPDGSRPLADAAVVVVGYTGYYVPERDEVRKVTITPSCGYASRTITMTYGQRLEIANQSGQLFAPTLDQDTLPAVMVAPPFEKGDPVKLYPRKAGYFTVSDRMQPYVHEDLYVFRHPLHAVTGLDGHYRIDGVPVGALQVGVHHPGIVNANTRSPVEIVAGMVKRVDLTLTYEPKEAKAVDAGRPPSWLN